LEPISEVLCVQWTLTVMSKCHVYVWLVCSPTLQKCKLHVELELICFGKIRKKKKLAGKMLKKL